MLFSLRSSSRALIFSALVLGLALPVAHAQSQASCTFKLFMLNPSGENLSPKGINSYDTVVGQASGNRAFARFANGGITYFSAPNSAFTVFSARNDGGTDVGWYSSPSNTTNSKGFILKGSTFISIVHPKAVLGTTLTGINKYNSISGWYLDAAEIPHSFKRYSNGSFVNLNYPGAQNTVAGGINDSGTVVGSFTDYRGDHGFIYSSGKWAPVDFGTTNTTALFGISNANKIVGVSSSNEPATSFLYENGTFKVISYPNSYSTQVAGIAANGQITGIIVLNNNDPTSGRGFTATCN